MPRWARPATGSAAPAQEMTLFAKLRLQQGFTPQNDKIMKKAVESGTIQTQIKVFETVCRRRMN